MALVFALRDAQRGIGPLVLFVLGGMITAAPVAYSLLGPSDLALRQRLRQEPKTFAMARTALESDAVHGWIESRAYYMQLGGVALAALAWVWLLVRAFRVSRLWGTGSLVFPPLGFVFAARFPRRGAIPVGILLVCLLVGAVPAIYTLTVAPDTSRT